MPIGAMLCKERADVFEPGNHASTFGGNPLACAAANCVTSKLSVRVLSTGTIFFVAWHIQPAQQYTVGRSLSVRVRECQFQWCRSPVVLVIPAQQGMSGITPTFNLQR